MGAGKVYKAGRAAAAAGNRKEANRRAQQIEGYRVAGLQRGYERAITAARESGARQRTQTPAARARTGRAAVSGIKRSITMEQRAVAGLRKARTKAQRAAANTTRRTRTRRRRK